MTVATYLFYGDNDALADVRDVEENAIPRIKNLKGAFKLFEYNHMDFIWGLRAAPEIYTKILNIITTEE